MSSGIDKDDDFWVKFIENTDGIDSNDDTDSNDKSNSVTPINSQASSLLSSSKISSTSSKVSSKVSSIVSTSSSSTSSSSLLTATTAVVTSNVTTDAIPSITADEAVNNYRQLLPRKKDQSILNVLADSLSALILFVWLRLELSTTGEDASN